MGGGLVFCRPVPFSPQQSSFIFKLPSDSLRGKLLLVEGGVEKESREKDELEEADIGVEILQGERLVTGEKSKAIVEFLDFAKIDLGANTEIGFISLIPANFLISQASGFVSYKLLKENSSLSVRSLHVLLTFYSGEGEVIVEEEEITIKVLSGEAKLALVDLDNETHVWELEEGQKALIEDTERKVEIQ